MRSSCGNPRQRKPQKIGQTTSSTTGACQVSSTTSTIVKHEVVEVNTFLDGDFLRTEDLDRDEKGIRFAEGEDAENNCLE